MNSYEYGECIVLESTFKNGAGVLTNPTTVLCKVRNASGELVTLGATSSSTGVWTASVLPLSTGIHWYRFEGTGAVTAAGEGSFEVVDSRVL